MSDPSARYNLLERWVEDGLLSALDENGVGCICFSPLAQGALTDKYLKGIPADSRASRAGTTVAQRYLSDEQLEKIKQIKSICCRAWSDTGADGDLMDLTPAGGDDGPGRSEPGFPAGQQSCGVKKYSFLRG